MRLAIYQGQPQPLDVGGNLQRLERVASAAAAQGAELLVCPEMFLSGYNIGVEQVRRLAEASDGPAALAVAEIARRAGLAIVYGYPERSAEGLLYNAAQCIDAQGRRLGNYRKTHLYGELDQGMFSASEAPSALFDFAGWKLGMLICYDVEFPENARQLALAGADLILVPTANMQPYLFVPNALVPTRAYENQVYLAYANYCGAEDAIEYCGLSCIAAPSGEVLARAQAGEELLLAEVDLERLRLSRSQFPFLQDRRPDVYSR